MENAIPFLQTDYRHSLPPLPRLNFAHQDDAEPRLNVVLPHINETLAFGGVVSALELARAASEHYPHIRFLIQSPLGDSQNLFNLQDYIAHPEEKQTETLELYSTAGIPCHQNEIFFCTFWTSVLAWELYTAHLRAAGLQPNPFYYFIQDYEPGFYPLGYKHARCKSTYGHGDWTCAIINSRELAKFFQTQKLRFGKNLVIPPSLHPELLPHLERRQFTLPPKPKRPIGILVYGRPHQPRNCFAAILEGLRIFFEGLPMESRTQFVIVSAGASSPHENIMLAPGAELLSVGKLAIPKYISFLERAHIGVSFMASPHPSYPPLEMASFGCRTITNRYENKDLSKTHDLIHSIGQPWPENLALKLTQLTLEIDHLPPGKISVALPSNMSPLPWRENLAALGIPRLHPETKTSDTNINSISQ